MELVQVYLDLYSKSKIGSSERNIDEKWQEFMESEAHTLSVFAGRGTGKTIHLVRYALSTPHDVIYFVHNEATTYYIMDLINQNTDPAEIRSIRRENRTRIIEVSNGKRIIVLHIPTEFTHISGLRYRGYELIFDEFDNDRFSRFIQIFEDIVRDAIRVICAGSIMTRRPNAAKAWFRDSEHKIFIDSAADHNFVPHEVSEEEMFPSRLKLMIRNMPSLSYNVV